MMLILFEDEFVPQLYPVAVGRPAFAIACGSFRLVDLLGSLGVPLAALVRPHLRDVQAADGLRESPAAARDDGLVALVNARLVPSIDVAERVLAAVCSGRTGVVRSGDAIALALLPRGATIPDELASAHDIPKFLEPFMLEPLELELPLLSYPHDIVRHHLTSLAPNLAYRLRKGAYREAADGVFLAEGARLGQYIVSETHSGPILVDERATIGPYTYLSGPAYVGPHARIIEHSAIKDAVSLGHTTKVGGEVEASIIESYTNKQHHGFLGHSYLGSWINLGAGTCNSDLKNTYGQVNMDYGGRKVATGMQFIGCIMGDYAKTAINTSVFTGKTIGVCSMVYGFVTTNVPSFVNYARSFGQVTEAPVEIMAATQARMFARRGVEQRTCDVKLLYDMYELTRHERQIAGEPLSL